MHSKAINRFIEYVSQQTGLDEAQINSHNAEYLLRILNKDGVVIPQDIKEEVFKYFRGGYTPRNHSSSRILEDLVGASSIEFSALKKFTGAAEHKEGTPQFLREPNVLAYLQAR